ncbi:TetR/AcrR family transcriptional regulator [Clostridium lundense]|uniref:TetR/AcrR family transcriptional regulator n=1 Tax=Clostridium lundense TaxID=319475 RepID=UPI000484F872|nr:TetR/AcrR family transcriptional regulator [Clostridium lundense]
MKKGITKEQVIEQTLSLIKDKENIRDVNLRGIARAIGCAHTNLYNHFSCFDDLLWCTHIAILKRFLDGLSEKISQIDDYRSKLECFFSCFVEFPLYNKGWFRLAWFEIIQGERPEDDKIATVETVDAFADIIENIWDNLYGFTPNKEKIKYVLHNVHCYIHGEVSIYIAKRSLIQDEIAFKNYVTKEAIKFTRLLLNEEG